MPTPGSLTALACLVAGTVAGILLSKRLPGHHVGDASKDTIKTGVGLVATMSALVLGLLVTSAKGTMDSATAVCVLVACAASVAGAIFLIVEMNQLMRGMLKVPDAAMVKAIEVIEQGNSMHAPTTTTR